MQILLTLFLWKHFLQRTEHSSQWNHAKTDIIIIAILTIQFFTIHSMIDSFRIAVVSLPLLSSWPKQESWYLDSSVPFPCLQFYSECYLSVDESRQTALQHAMSALHQKLIVSKVLWTSLVVLSNMHRSPSLERVWSSAVDGLGCTAEVVVAKAHTRVGHPACCISFIVNQYYYHRRCRCGYLCHHHHRYRNRYLWSSSSSSTVYPRTNR